MTVRSTLPTFPFLLSAPEARALVLALEGQIEYLVDCRDCNCLTSEGEARFRRDLAQIRKLRKRLRADWRKSGIL